MTDETENDTFPNADAWRDESNGESESHEAEAAGGESTDFAVRVEEIREQRDGREQEQNDDGDGGEESLDEAVERLSGRVYRVKYRDPADRDDTERERLVADDIQPTAAGMAFVKDDTERVRVYPAPVDIKRLDDDAVRSWAKSKRRLSKMLKPIARAFGGGSSDDD